MTSYEHGILIRRVAELDVAPEDATAFDAWVRAAGHLDLLRENANEKELVVYASGPYSFIHTLVVSEDKIFPVDKDDLLHWSGNPFVSRSSYTWNLDSQDVWVSEDYHHGGSNCLKEAHNLVFGRESDGFDGRHEIYYEILQEYCHLAEIHWRPEHHAYCRFNYLGDLEYAISISVDDDRSGVNLVSFRRDYLDQYLAATNSVLVRLFEFPFYRKGTLISTSPDRNATSVLEGDDSLFYYQKIDIPHVSWARGVQIVRPVHSNYDIFSQVRGNKSTEPVDYIALDFRNGDLAHVSTDPSTTTTYFAAKDNDLPLETSPVFFKPDVLLKYKADRDKYTLLESSGYITCRGGWMLRSYDVNEAGQIYVYICDLREIPYEEQLYWKTYNEEPKTGISKRSYQTDFLGQPTDSVTPLVEVMRILGHWGRYGHAWWKLRDEGLLGRMNTPLTLNRDEWAQSFSDLSKIVIEGFQTKIIRQHLAARGVPYLKEEGSIILLERLLVDTGKIEPQERLSGLRTVQLIRSKASSHFGGSEAEALAKDALVRHNTYLAHFESVCEAVAVELEAIQDILS